MSIAFSTHRGSGRHPRAGLHLGLACSLAISAVGIALNPAGAAAAATVVNSPPANGHSIIVFPQRDFIHVDGYAAGDVLTFEDFRNGVVIGTSTGVIPTDDPTTPGFDGMVDLNHLGAPCWSAVTPDILPGDVIRVTDQRGVADETPTANVTVTQAATNVGGAIVMKGTAADAAGAQLAAGSFEARVISKKLRYDANGKRDIRATPVYDAPGSTSWTATWTGLDAHDQDIAVNAGESRTLWLGRAPGAVNALGSPTESTIYEYGAVGGPAAGCSAPQASYAVTSSTPASLNVATNAGDLVLSGTAQDATSVTVTLTDAAGTVVTAPASSPTPATGAQTWSVTLPAALRGDLVDGPLKAAGSYTLADGSVITGASKTLLKDTVAPASPGATPPGGTYTTAQAVTLSNPENVPMYTTVDGSTPTSASAGYGGQISVTASQTIKAIAVDPAGNPSAVSTNAYVISSAVAPSAPATVAATAGDGQATITWTAPTSDGGAAVTSYRVSAVTLSGAQPADVIVTAGTTATMTGLTNGAQYAFDVSATNQAGAGPVKRSNTVTPAAPQNPPGAPTGVVASAGNGSANVTWTAPANPGTSPITGYTVQAFNGASPVGTALSVAATARAATVSGLTNGTSYTTQVNAVNAVGSSPAGVSNAVVPTAPALPGAATGVTATRGNASATVGWVAPTTGAAVTGYQVLVTQGGVQVGALRAAAATARSLVVTGLSNGTTYSVQVRAVGAGGAGAYSGAVSVTPATTPGAPVIGIAVAGVAGGTITATAKWSAPASTGGSAVTGYRVSALRMSSTGAVLSTTVSTVQLATSRTLAMTLPAIGNYRFTVQAINAVGSGTQSARSNLVAGR
ncbi:fibronectin type III domain-containing protein [Terrabacter sp. BE26]|uniref:fibronectin type III domain-containing protein n=1 Tax=Terrabacter sp. BE26 TaxID=2898152 RepID=UPI0035BE5479